VGEDTELDIESLASALTDEEDGRRLLALQALQECDRRAPLPEPILGPLLACLGHRRKAIQRTAAEVLALWSRATPEIRTRLLRLLASGDFHLRWGTAFTLAKIGPEPASLPVLIETLGRSDGDMRWAAQGIVVDLARKSAEIHGALLDLASEGSPTQRKMSLYCLRDLGRRLASLLGILLDQLKHAEGDVRLAALSALARLYADDAAIVSPIIDVVRFDPEPGVRRAAVSTLGKLRRGSPHAPEIERVLDEASSSDDEGLRKAAIGARRSDDSREGEA
jgi:HEAT repeat protein